MEQDQIKSLVGFMGRCSAVNNDRQQCSLVADHKTNAIRTQYHSNWDDPYKVAYWWDDGTAVDWKATPNGKRPELLNL